ncbi:hypothetical protein ACE6H2_015143 [Prunus campanulata]
MILKTQKLVGLAGYRRMYRYKAFPAVLSVNWIIKCHARRPKFDWPSSNNNCKSSPDKFYPESDSALTHNLHFVTTRRPHFLVVPEEMWLEKMREQLMETLTSR